MRIGGRIPFVVVHAVEDAEQGALAFAQQGIQAFAKFLRGDFPRVTRTDRGDDIRESDPGFQTIQLPVLDRIEGRGHGYERKTVSVSSPLGEQISAETYIATNFDPTLRPLDWYKEHVVRGARSIGLPPSYIASIEAVVVDIDLDEERRTGELMIYG